VCSSCHKPPPEPAPFPNPTQPSGWEPPHAALPPRTFESGATRGAREGKLLYDQYFSAAVARRRAQFMAQHDRHEDGSLRPSDNWKKGIPLESCIESGTRHWHDVLLLAEGWEVETDHDLEEALCAVMFNCEAALHGLLRARQRLAG
jgi:hypothetical protein